ACMRRDRVAADALLARHPEFLRSPEPLFVAAKQDRVDVAEFILDLGVSPDVENEKGERPLHIAAYEDSLGVAKLLIDRGAAVDPVESNWGNTPLGAATYSQATEVIELLGDLSRDVWELTINGKVDRLRDVLRTQPERARVNWKGNTLLMWLPEASESA